MKLRTIAVLLLIVALIGGSLGVVAAEQADGEHNGHPNCDNWPPGQNCDRPPEHAHNNDKAGGPN